MAKVSVIMPVYNAAAYLERSIGSVLVQTMTDFELIVVDDGSTDASPAICDRLAAADRRFRVIHRSNSGPAASRNAALDLATGRYLMFCDADDEYRPDFCRRMVEEIERSQADAVVCQCDFLVEDGVSEQVRASRIGREGEGFNTGLSGVADDMRTKLFDINVLLWNKIFKRDVVRKFGIRFPDGHEHDDDAFWFQYALACGPVLRIVDRLYLYRLRPGSIADSYVARKPRNRMDRIAAMEAVATFAERNGLVAANAPYLVRLWMESYQMVLPFFEESERAGLRAEVLSKSARLFSKHHRLVESYGDLVWINHAGRFGDLMSYGWHRFRSLLAFGNEAKRVKVLRKAERSLLSWRSR